MSDYHRDVAVYSDAAGRSDAREALIEISRSDRRAARAIDNRIRVLRQHLRLSDALAAGLIKQPTTTIYVLRVQSGSVSYRLPFFEAPDRADELVVFTHCEHRSLLRRDGYKLLIEAAERRRQDWIRRNAKEGE